MSEPKLSRRKILKRGVGLGLLACGADAFGVEPNWVDVERIEIPIQGLGAGLDGYRISLFSDIHWPRNIERDYVRRIVGLANAFEPDLIAIPGDLCDRKGSPLEPNWIPRLGGLFDGLRAKDGVVATFGNHDHMFNLRLLRQEVEDATPLELIENRHRIIRRAGARFAIGGVEDLRFGRVDPVAAFAGLSPEVPRILLSHNPDVAEDVVWPTRIDLQLSGHTHGGEMRFPFGPSLVVPSKYGNKFREGLVEGRSHRVYTTRGVCSPRRIRFFCRPEVTYLTLRAA